MGLFTKGMQISGRDLLSSIILSAFVLGWAASFLSEYMSLFLQSIGASELLILLNLLSFIVASFIGGLLLDKVKRKKPFLLLFFFGALSLLLPIFKNVYLTSIYVVGSGIAAGLVAPAAFSFFAEHTRVYARGRVAGMIVSGEGFLLLLFIFAASLSLDLFFATTGAMTITGGLIGLFLVKDQVISEDFKRIPTKNVFSERNLLLFVSVVAIMSVFTGSVANIMSSFPEGLLVDPGEIDLIDISAWAVSAFFVGVLADRFGRRPVIVLGTILCTTSLLIFVAYRTTLTLLLTAILLGVWYASTFGPVLLASIGDISREGTRGRSYGLGLASLFGGLTLGVVASSILILSSDAVVMSFIIFVAFLILLPVLIADETLPSKAEIEEFRDYIRRIKDETGEKKE